MISDYPLGTRPDANNFPPRNRIISGLSRGVVVVEAGERSGALITAKFAAEQGRDVFAVPGSILHPGSAGCNSLIQQGATPLLSVDDVLEQLNMVHLQERMDARRSVAAGEQASEQEAKMLALLSAEPTHIDDIVRGSQHAGGNDRRAAGHPGVEGPGAPGSRDDLCKGKLRHACPTQRGVKHVRHNFGRRRGHTVVATQQAGPTEAVHATSPAAA